MSRWFRHYAGLCRDDKLVSAAIKAKQPVERVVWVWCAILESAAEIDDAGQYGLDAAEVAYFLRADEADILAIEAALQAAGRVAEGRVVKWGNRQFSSDRSKERVAAHRQRKRSEGVRTDVSPRECSGEVTLQTCHGNSPETETETEDTASAVSERARLPYDEIEQKCRKAAGLEQDPSPSLCDLSPIIQFLDVGADLERQIIPVIRAKRRCGVRSWRFFVPSITEALAAKPPIIAKPKTFGQEESWKGMLTSFASGYWNDHWGPPPDSPQCRIPAAFIAANRPEALEIMDRQCGRAA